MADIAKERIQGLLGEMTLEEKIGMIHGNGLFETKAVERLGIPSLVMSDGPMGVRRDFPRDSWEPVGTSADYATYLPSNVALAATWSSEAALSFGQILGSEARGRGKDVILAPGVNIVRSPLCGRNFEYLGEDPFLVSRMAVALVRGIQSQDVAACVKHFAVNNQETNRLEVSVDVEDAALWEIYFPAFRAAVEEGGAMAVMAAYNRFRGDFCTENPWLLKTVLREKWGFRGLVISDWGAVHHTRDAASSGLDIEMAVHTDFQSHHLADEYRTALDSGNLPVSDLDEKVRNILTVMDVLKIFDGHRNRGRYNTLGHHQGALAIARESVVLMKNQRDLLPLSRKNMSSVLVIGANANALHAGGGGSAEVKALFEISPLAGITMAAGGDIPVTFLPGYAAEDATDPQEQRRLRDEALAMAKDFSGTVIYVGGLNHFHDREEFDREDLVLPYQQDHLIAALLDLRPDTILVNLSGSPVAMPWIDSAATLVQLFYAGMFSGQALGEVLFGDVNPSGKLPVTFPVRLEDSPAHAVGDWPGDDKVVYREGLFVGYRYHDSEGIAPLFPFGHGLSYSRWEYSEFRIIDNESDVVEVALSVRNKSSVPGAEVVQLYAEDLQNPGVRPLRELKGFKKIFLGSGESAELRLRIGPQDLACFDLSLGDLVPGHGTYRLHVGSSSRDLRCEIEATIPAFKPLMSDEAPESTKVAPSPRRFPDVQGTH